MKKKVIISICIVIAIVLLTPIPMPLNDGGTVEYTALLYKVSDVHRAIADMEYNDGIIVEILGFEIFNNVK
ncbi:MAG: hypothetical protein IJX55_03735 [Clostridia bacterium]|nr:hypothetical protein [Clostridia bacterium]